jgi:hypothetical protein
MECRFNIGASGWSTTTFVIQRTPQVKLHLNRQPGKGDLTWLFWLYQPRASSGLLRGALPCNPNGIGHDALPRFAVPREDGYWAEVAQTLNRLVSVLTIGVKDVRRDL